MRAFYTIGYEGTSPRQLIGILERQNVLLLVDIRSNPWSRIRGFSRKKLTEILPRNGIEYIHEPLLGTPQRIRQNYCRTGNVKLALARYREYLRGHLDRLELLKESVNGRTLCFLCLERDWRACHRSVVAEEFTQISGWRAVHL